MIRITNNSDCCGCESCKQICPKNSITMRRDAEGFLYPTVDMSSCIDCHLCERVCPMIIRGTERRPLEVLAAKSCNEVVRLSSSSGGIFTPLAEHTLRRGGVVFGAKFNDKLYVEHTAIEDVEALSALRGSKYLQSIIGDSYKRAEEALKGGREVLFSGTPCQIAGLKCYLRREYESLLTVEVVCHGVPSPKVWQEYMDGLSAELKIERSDIEAISFRDKSRGWKNFSFRVDYKREDSSHTFVEPFQSNTFMRGFLQNLYLRPSCHNCPARSGRSGADISIADHWGIERINPQLDDDKGLGLLLINSERGKSAFEQIASEVEYATTPYAKALAYNPCIEHSVAEPKLRNSFWHSYEENGIAAIEATCSKLKVSIVRRAINKLRRIIKI